ncbi:ATP12 family chaperone protein [Bartonella sp. F02]|uniref:ATP12 family chaperone protein n=1 Tax=Bartonella sp. F02 TaxID=2967262 RepID=UPI0022A936C2|nr:ATP12 family protein [Bartonella sp. F02]MCZ2328151.1 ATPase [Bartonella sp. F02]
MREILYNFDQPSNQESPIHDKSQDFLRQSLPKRFYQEVSVLLKENGFSILLDGNPVKTPAKRHLCVPTEALAERVAQEFDIQKKVIDPAKMPITRLVNTVVDGVVDDMQVIFEDLLRFAACDMVFYRAQTPKELVQRQCEQWDFLLDWAEEKIGARFNLAEGLVHIEQPREAIQAVSTYLRKVESPYVLAALHSMTTLTGSALIAFSVAEKKIDVDKAWAIAHLDEDWAMEQWGVDEEVITRRTYKKAEFDAASMMIVTCL